MKIRLAVVILLSAVLAACKSTIAPVSVYMLSPQADTAAGVNVATDRPAVVLERVVLAEYLRQSGLVMQTGANQLQVSKTNLWAESLDLALPKALVRELERHWPQYRFYLSSDFVSKADYRLRLNVDSFHIHVNGEVIAEGKFQLIGNTNNSNMTQSFHFARTLQEDGYPYAVAQLQMLTTDIAMAIGKTLPAQPGAAQ